MTAAKKVLLAIILIPTSVILIIAAAWDANWFKSDVETQLSDVENHQVSFTRFEHSLLSPGELSIHDIQIRGGIVNGNIGSLSVAIDILPALQKRVIVKQVTLNNAVLAVDMNALQAYSKSDKHVTTTAPGTSEPLPIERLSIESVLLRNISIKDVSTQQLFTLNDFNIEITDIVAIDNFQMVLLDAKSFLAVSFFIEEVLTNQINIGKVSGEALLNREMIDVQSLTLESTGSKLAVSGFIKNPKQHAEVQLVIDDSTLDVADFAPLLGHLPVLPSGIFTVAGAVDTQGDLGAPKQLLQALNGHIDLGMNNGALQGIDINKLVTAIKDSQTTSLRDIGGFLVSGPLGLIGSNMFDLSGGTSAFDGTTEIPQLQLKSQFEKGMLQLQDTALSTDQHRLAFSGSVDMGKQTFHDFTFALLDAEGCAEVKQTLNGAMSKPTSAVSKSLLDSALSPLNNLIGTVKKSLGEKCTPFYQGEVTHPEG
ncbi:MAG: AsmA-like C-terminal region-containing protein [Aestuariibacter sp.]